jgi:HK97 family phage prohead protease
MSEVHRRQIELRAVADETKPGQCRVIASTSAPVNYGCWSETLLHGRDNIDMSGAASMLFNHDCDQPIGGIQALEADGKELHADVEIDTEARASTGIKIWDAIQRKYIRGISIGYTYDYPADCDVTTTQDASGHDFTAVVVRKWQLREISLTPTPADLAAQVLRSLPAGFVRAYAAQEGALMSDTKKQEPSEPQGDNGAAELKKREDELAKMRAENKALQLRTIRAEAESLGRSHGVELSKADLEKIQTSEDAKDLILARKAAASTQKPTEPTVVDVQRDAGDKIREAAEDGLLHLGGCTRSDAKNLGLRGRAGCAIFRAVAKVCGEASDEMSNLDLYRVFRGETRGLRAANQTSGMFSYIVSNVADKAVLNGFNSAPARWRPLVCIRNVNDYKAFMDLAGVVGLLSETAENLPYSELTIAEVGVQNQLVKNGGTISLTEEALVNDDLGEFVRLLNSGGMIADRSIEFAVTKALVAWDFSGKTTEVTTAGDPTAANAGKVRAALMKLADPSGNPMGNEPTHIVVPPSQFDNAWKLCFPGPAAQEAQSFAGRLKPVELPWLESATAGTGYSTDDWYMSANPSLGIGLRVAFLNGQETPRLQEFDAGATDARKWKVKLPFKAYVATKYGLVKANKS